MSQKTIQCRLVASEAARRCLWELAAEKNTPLINALIQEVVSHQEFETWRKNGRHSERVVKEIGDQLAKQAPFSGQPQRLRQSAIKIVNYTFKSWFKVQQCLQWSLSGHQKWLEILKCDEELSSICEKDLLEIKQKAVQILKQMNKAVTEEFPECGDGIMRENLVRKKLYKKYDSAKSSFIKCAVGYLLKNSCEIPERPEDPETLTKRRRETEKDIEALQKQLESHLPKGRDLTGDIWLKTLLSATTSIPKDDEEYKSWESHLLAKPKDTPYPLLFETKGSMTWSRNDGRRLCVRFSGLSEHHFKIYCDSRDIHWFERFFEDQEITKKNGKKHSEHLYTLRSARIIWKEGVKKGAPWDRLYIYLHCTVDVRLWAQEGTEAVRHEIAEETAQALDRARQKPNPTKGQKDYIQRLMSSLQKLPNDFPRPTKPSYLGQDNIIVGLSLGWDRPLTVAVWNAEAEEVLAFRSTKQLLGKDYPLFLRQRQEQPKKTRAQRKSQKRFQNSKPGTTNIGLHVDRLLAKAVVEVAKHYSANSIAIPNLKNTQSKLKSEIDVRAEQKIPGYLEGQKKYSRAYKRSIHKWSYRRLIDQISSKASQEGLVIEESSQPTLGNAQEKARMVAISAYESRKAAVQNN